MKFTKHHNHVARKNLVKSRKAKLAGVDTSANKDLKRGPARQTEPKKSTWSLSSLLKNVTSYFTGETTTNTQTKKRVKRTHTSKKSTKSATSTATATTGKK